MLKRKIIAILLLGLFALPGVAMGKTIDKSKTTEPQDIVSMAPGYPDIKAKGAILIDEKSGQVLYGLNMHKSLYPASTTKILTGIIVLEKARMDDIVTVSENATRQDGTRLGLQPGEKIKVKDLLYAMLLNSDNDAAVALAEHISGSTARFARLMNSKAKELGAKNSNFVNPDGLTDPGHYTSAYDLAMIARYAMKNPTFRNIVGTVEYDIKRDVPNGQTKLATQNRLIQPFSYHKYEGANGVKTGYTTAAQQTIVASAERDNRDYIAVVLNTGPSFEYASDLLNFAFNKFHSVDVTQQGEFVKSIQVKYGKENVNLLTRDNFSVSLPEDVDILPRHNIVLDTNIKAPIKVGQKLGRIDYYYDDQKVGSVDLVAQNKVDRKLTTRKGTWGIVAFVTGGGLFLFLMSNLRRRAYRRKRLKKVHRIWYDKDL